MSDPVPHIGLTAEWIGTRAGGLETYARNLICALGQSGAFRLTAYTTAPDALVGLSGVSAHYLGTRSRAVFHGWALPRELRLAPPDLLHVTSIPPLFSAAPYVMTLHDMGHRVMPEMYPGPVRWRLNRMITHGLHRARRIICVSEATRADLFRFHPEIAPDRVDVVGEGGLLQPPPPDPTAEAAVRAGLALDTSGLDRPYFLYVGRMHVRKNLLGLIDAYAALPERLRAAHPLVLVGRAMYGGAEIPSRIAHHGIGQHVRLMGHLPDAVLPALYRGALAFVYPSLFEGFGLPPLEAMSLGTPALCSNRSATPEVVGDAGLCVDTTDIPRFTAALQMLAENPELRDDLRQRGLVRARLFTWDRAAAETAAVYDRALAGLARGARCVPITALVPSPRDRFQNDRRTSHAADPRLSDP